MYFFLYNKDWCDFFKSPYSNWFDNEKRGSSSSGGEALRECSAPTGFAALGALVEARSLWQTQKFRQQGLIPGELIAGAGIPPSPQHRAQGSLSQPSLSSVSVGSLCFLPLVCDFLSACHRSAINGINCINCIDILHSVFCKQPQGLHWTPREGEGLRKELGQKCSRGRAENEPGQNLGGLCWSWHRGESEGLSWHWVLADTRTEPWGESQLELLKEKEEINPVLPLSQCPSIQVRPLSLPGSCFP